MKKDNQSIFCIPRFEIIKIKDDDLKYYENFHKGSIGISIFLTKFLESLKTSKTPSTIYLYGMGVISNERSKNFNNPPSRPDLLICSGAIKPKLLIEIKYTESNNNAKTFEKYIDILSSGENNSILCNVEDFENYTEESNKIGCPVVIVRVFKLKYDGSGGEYTRTHFFGVELKDSLKEKLTVKKRGSRLKKEVYCISFDDVWKEEELFDILKDNYLK